MNVLFDKSFEKSLDLIDDKKLKEKLSGIILQLESVKNLNEIQNLRKLTGFRNYYRIRIGDYRLGFELTDVNTIRLVIICHRKDIYKNFP